MKNLIIIAAVGLLAYLAISNKKVSEIVPKKGEKYPSYSRSVSLQKILNWINSRGKMSDEKATKTANIFGQLNDDDLSFVVYYLSYIDNKKSVKWNDDFNNRIIQLSTKYKIFS